MQHIPVATLLVALLWTLFPGDVRAQSLGGFYVNHEATATCPADTSEYRVSMRTTWTFSHRSSTPAASGGQASFQSRSVGRNR